MQTILVGVYSLDMSSEVEQIKERIDIVEYIGRSVVLKKAGRNFTGLCPFHGEHTPSFNVSPDRQIFKCFGCGVSGDVITFVMQREGLDFSEALKILALEAGVELRARTVKEKEEDSLEDRLFEMHRLAAEFYHWLLVSHESGDEAREYLKGRGFEVSVGSLKNAGGETKSETGGKSGKGGKGGKGGKRVVEYAGDVVSYFKLGYAPKSWDSLGTFLFKKGYSVEEMRAGGLVVASEKSQRGYFDMFRGRVMFPLVDKVGRVVGFAGRVLGTDKTAKYINTAETAIFHKREFLFGFYQAKEDILKKGEAILVEGEMDMLSSFQAGVRNVVAVKGSALTEEQIGLLSRVSKKLLLCFDADTAGDMAMRKAIQLAESKGLEVKVIQVKVGKDPDECIRKGVSYWLESIESAVPYYDFLLQSAVKRHGVTGAEGKKRVVRDVLPQLLSIENIVERSHYVQRLSTIVDIPEQELVREVSKVQQSGSGGVSGAQRSSSRGDGGTESSGRSFGNSSGSGAGRSGGAGAGSGYRNTGGSTGGSWSGGGYAQSGSGSRSAQGGMGSGYGVGNGSRGAGGGNGYGQNGSGWKGSGGGRSGVGGASSGQQGYYSRAGSVSRPPVAMSKSITAEAGYLQKRHGLEEYFMALLVKLRRPVEGILKKVHVADIDDKSIKEVYTSYTNFFAEHQDAAVEDYLRSIDETILPIVDNLFLVDVPFESDEELRGELFVTIKNFKEMGIREDMRRVSLEIKQLEILGDMDRQIPVLQDKLGHLVERLGKLQQLV
jgi:DNA primase